MTLRDILNVPTEIAFEGEAIRIRQPNQLEQGEFQVWLEQLALDGIARRTYPSDADREKSLRMHDQDCAAGVYEWGGEVAVRRVMTPKGFAKLLAIVCRDQGLTEKKAERLIELESRQIAARMASKATDDPKVLEAVRVTLGLPSDFFSSASPTPPSTTGSTTSPPCPTTS